VKRRLSAVAALAVVALLATACDKATAANDASTPGAPGPAATSAAAPPNQQSKVYKSADDLCAVADLSALTEKFPNQSQPRHETTPSGGETEMTCSVRLTAAGNAYGLVQLTVNVLDTPESARSTYERIKDADTRTAPGGKMTDVPGVGSAAYTFVDESVGPRLVTTDGNLCLTINWAVAATAVSGAGTVPSDIVTRLSAVAKGTMAKLG
jgi:hypothetical protein